MEEVQQALAALVDGVADVLTAGLGAGAELHDESRSMQRELRGQAMARAVLGRQLSTLAAALTGAAVRKTEARYAAYRQHPRYGREQHIDEAEAADRSLNKALLPMLEAPSSADRVAFWGALIRVRAITAVIGTACIYPPAGTGVETRRRRREMTAADVPAPVAEVLLDAADQRTGIADAVVSLQALETTEHNAGAIVTKLLALLQHEDGREHLNRIAHGIRSAVFDKDQQRGRIQPVLAVSPQPPAVGTTPKRRAAERIPQVLPQVAQPQVGPSRGAEVAPPPAARSASPGTGSKAKALLQQLGSTGSTLPTRLAASHAQMKDG